MAEQDKEQETRREESGSSGTATVKPKRAPKKNPRRKPPQPLPPWKVLLHNDDKNEFPFVMKTFVEVTPLNEKVATQRTYEANDSGVALLLPSPMGWAVLLQVYLQSSGRSGKFESE